MGFLIGFFWVFGWDIVFMVDDVFVDGIFWLLDFVRILIVGVIDLISLLYWLDVEDMGEYWGVDEYLIGGGVFIDIWFTLDFGSDIVELVWLILESFFGRIKLFIFSLSIFVEDELDGFWIL